MRDAVDLNISSTSIKPLASKVAPVETKSQMPSDKPTRGATSTDPFNKQKSTLIPLSLA